MGSRSFERALSTLIVASGAVIAMAPNMAGVDPKSFSGVRTDLGVLTPSFGWVLIALGVGITVVGITSTWIRSKWVHAVSVAASAGVIVALLTAHASVLVGTAGERSFGLLDLGGIATQVAFGAAGLALLAGLALAALPLAGDDGAVLVFRAPD